jgi:trans-2,3-dihydro-3-hydroxyanthranilate isomerase
MKYYPFIQVDAFTQHALGGNPCAVFFDCEDMNDETMQAVTREMNLSESAFLLPPTTGDFKVRYFTPMGEIPMAGHPTIATTFALVESGKIKLVKEKLTISLELNVGIIPVEILSINGNVTCITMSQKTPEFMRIYDASDVLPIFGLSETDLVPYSPIQTVSTGTPQLMIHVRDLDVLRKINVTNASYQKLHQQGDWFSSHIFCLHGVSDKGSTFARHLSPPPDLFEDPFTGSATGGMAAYLWHYGFLDRPEFIAEQGHWLHRPGQAFVEVVGDRNNIKTVKVGGSAVSVLTGTLKLPS